VGRRRGGAAAADAFYDRRERDDLLSSLFPGGVSEAHRDHASIVSVRLTWRGKVASGRFPGDYFAT
jgi:hemoglobin